MTAEIRKIQKTGSASFTVSLPKSWIRKNSVKQGDIVSIYEEKDQSLRITIDTLKEQKKQAVIDAGEINDEVEVLRRFISYYIGGANKIVLIYKKPLAAGHMKKIKSIKNLIGFEIVEETDNKIIFQDFFTSRELSIKKAARRAFNISRLVIKESQKRLNNADIEPETIQLWEEEMNKIYLLIRRQINFAIHNSKVLGKLDITLKEAQDFILLIGAIEKITDIYVDISGVEIELTERNLEKINTLYNEILEIYETAFLSIFEQDYRSISQAISRNEKLFELSLSFEEEEERSRKTLNYVLYNIMASTRFIEEITELGLDVIA